MSLPLEIPLSRAVLVMGALLMGCGSAGYAVDSATSACQQNPLYCAAVAGEEAVVPTAIRGGAEVASVAATLKVLTPQIQAHIEQALVECVEWANAEVNRQRFGGRSPSRARNARRSFQEATRVGRR